MASTDEGNQAFGAWRGNDSALGGNMPSLLGYNCPVCWSSLKSGGIMEVKGRVESFFRLNFSTLSVTINTTFQTHTDASGKNFKKPAH